MGEPLTKLNPQLDEPINVTDFLEYRHLIQAIHFISSALNDYMSGYSRYEASGTTFLSDDFIWISIGDIPLSQKLKEGLCAKFKVTNGKLSFKNWNNMATDYPEITTIKHLHGKKPSFIGFPLPSESDSEV